MTARQILSADALACHSSNDQLISPFTGRCHPSMLLRGGAGGGVDRRLIFVLRVYNQGVQEA